MDYRHYLSLKQYCATRLSTDSMRHCPIVRWPKQLSVDAKNTNTVTLTAGAKLSRTKGTTRDPSVLEFSFTALY